MNTQKVLKKLEIGVASPKQIKYWAERFLPNGEIVGEVTSWETVNYKTLKPEPNGLFCQKTFGPIVDFTCACGKKTTKKLGKTNFDNKRSFCIKCGVERTHSRVRRYRLGYIKLKQPIVHALYASHRPSPLNLCLNWPTKRFQSVMKASEFCFFPFFFSTFRSYTQSSQFFINRVQLLKILKKKVIEKNNIFFLKLDDQKKKKVKLLTLIPKTKVIQILDNGPKTCKKAKQKKPRLFTKINLEKKKKQGFVIRSCSLSNQENEIRLYGIGYDATWRQVEEFQEFLFYLWEHSFSYESNISYYVFIKQVQTYAPEIPKHEQSYAIQTGAIAFQQILSHLNIRGLQQELENQSIKSQESIQITREKIAKLDFNYKEDRKKFKKLKGKTNKLQQLQLKCRRQLELFRDFERENIQPAWMICSYIPVLPPGLRPITSIGGEFIVSDINYFYRKVLIRNKRITFLVHFGIFDTALSGSWLSWCYNIRQIQEAVDELLKTGSVEAGKPLKSLLDGLKGKRGRFRQHLLGKRVDYSGRSVIVVGPLLKLYQCGLPKQMAIELFQPFIIQKLRKRKIVFTTTAAKALIAKRKPIVWSILCEICRTHPILLNRAPTLHRLGIQAFLPRLVEGKAILLHPLVCPAFNADFDGDQMAVHVPLSAKTRAEALNLLWSRNNLLAPASGQPILLPTQDMVLGFYYLTCSHEQSFQNLENPITIQTVLLKNKPLSKFKQNIYFSELYQVQSYYDRGTLSLHTKVWVKWPGFVETFITEQQASTKENSIETRIDLSGRRDTLFKENCQLFNLVFNFKKHTIFFKKTYFIRTTPGRILMHSCLF